ncbi:MAG: RNA-directed DNA polymerase [Bacilli bacterium]
MKRKGFLYDEIVDIDKIRDMFNHIKNNCKSKKAVNEFMMYKEEMCSDIYLRLKQRDYMFYYYHIFLITEPKYRIIMAEVISDKVANQMVSSYILIPSIESSLIDTNVATRIDKGSRYAVNAIKKYINIIKYERKEVYVLKLDISKYFYNIDHKILINKLSDKIKDPEALNIIKDILSSTNKEYVNEGIKKLKENEIKRISSLNISFNEKEKKINEISSIPTYQKDKGLPIGNMTSQILAIFYLNDVDHFIKETLGYKYYVRYMDDLFLISTNKEKLLSDKYLIIKEIEKEKLKTNRKTNIYKLSVGVSFLGLTFKLWGGHLIVTPRSETLRRINNRLSNLMKYDYEAYLLALPSYKGYIMNSDVRKFNRKEINDIME